MVKPFLAVTVTEASTVRLAEPPLLAPVKLLAPASRPPEMDWLPPSLLLNSTEPAFTTTAERAV